MEGPTHPQHAVLWLLVKVIHRYIDPQKPWLGSQCSLYAWSIEGTTMSKPRAYEQGSIGADEKSLYRAMPVGHGLWV